MKNLNVRTAAWILIVSLVGMMNGCSNNGIASESGLGEELAPLPVVALIIPNEDDDVVEPICSTDNTSVIIGEGDTSHSSTSRNIAINSKGNIFVAYRNSNGIFVTKSEDSGMTFSDPLLVSDMSFEVSINISNNDNIYLTWVDDENDSLYFSRSIDDGKTFEVAKKIGTFSDESSIHIASDSEHIYILSQMGDHLFVSHNNGADFNETAINTWGVYSDIRVDRVTHKVYLQTDDPELKYSVSNDYAETFSEERTPGGEIYYSTTAFSSYENGAYLFVSGSENTDAYRIDLDANTSDLLTFGYCSIDKGRSLAADNIGNVVDGYQKESNDTVTSYFAVSQNIGENFDTEVKVDDNATNISVAIEPVCDKVVVSYTKDGDVHINTYVDMLAKE